MENFSYLLVGYFLTQFSFSLNFRSFAHAQQCTVYKRKLAENSIRISLFFSIATHRHKNLHGLVICDEITAIVKKKKIDRYFHMCENRIRFSIFSDNERGIKMCGGKILTAI